MSIARWCILAMAVALAACGGPEAGAPDAAIVDAGPSYPPPRDDLVPALGSVGAIDVATWNIENFPKGVSTIAFVADLVASMDLDLIALQEIEDVAAFEELDARLLEYEGLLSTHTYGNGSYQKVGFLYRTGLVTLREPTLLFTEMGYELPRPPLEVRVHVDDGVHPTFDMVAIVLHLKAGFDDEDRARRDAAIRALEAHVAALVAAGDDRVMVLGDYNEILTSSAGRATMAPWLDAPAAYQVHTDELAQLGGFSFIPFQTVLDHIVTTSGLSDQLAGNSAAIPRLDQQTFNYESAVSDHLPVWIGIPGLE